MTTTAERSGFSVRTRITASVALLVMLALGSAGALVYLVQARRVEDQVTSATDRQFATFDAFQRTNADRYRSVGALLDAYLLLAVPDEDQALVVWYDDGRMIRRSAHGYVGDPDVFRRRVAAIAQDNGTTTIDDPKDTLVVDAQTVSLAGQSGAFVVVSYDGDVRAPLVETMRTYLLVAVLALAVITALAHAQAGRLLAPLRAMRRTAEEISDTDLSRRLPVAGNDDITDLTRTVNTMLDRLESAFTEQRRFLDDAGHELRTPLTVLQGHLELSDVGGPAEVAETRALLLDEVERMSRLVGELILLAKSDRPDFVTPRPVDLTDLTVDALAKARALGARRWVLDRAASGTATVDGQRLTQALLQLADNAVKHTPPDAVVAIGSALGETGPAEVLLWVRDTGAGVDRDDEARIFERFGRGRVGPGDDGFGLGLSIVQAIAQAHGGRVELEQMAPHGARFTLRIPDRRSPGEPNGRPDRASQDPVQPSVEELTWWPGSSSPRTNTASRRSSARG